MTNKNFFADFLAHKVMLLSLFVFFTAGISVSAEKTPHERRAFLLQLPPAEWRPETLLPYLEDADPLVRRTAARQLVQRSASAEILEKVLFTSDNIIKSMALQKLSERKLLSKKHLRQLLADQEPLVRREAVQKLSAFDFSDPEIVSLLTLASQDPAPSVRGVALKSLLKGEATELPSLRDEDFDVRELFTLQLPESGWRFQLDADDKGYFQKWHAVDFMDAGWPVIGIGKVWQSFGYDYVGAAWYRLSFDLPEKIDCDGVEIDFHGVDESAWVWINGHYVGSHDIGAAGYNVRFNLNITPAIIWGASNQITVRVQNTAAAGGIWKPVFVYALKVLRPN